MLSNFRNIALAAFLALVVGYCAGYYTKSRFVKADQLDAATEAQAQTADDIQASLKISQAVEQGVAASSQQIGDIRTQVANRMRQKEKEVVYVEHEVPVPAADVCALDAGTVGLLNRARAGTAADAAGGEHDEGETAPAVEIAEFIDNDLQVVEQYHELAIRHDALVEYVEALIERQAN